MNLAANKKNFLDSPGRDVATGYSGLLNDIRSTIDQARASVAVQANSALTLLYWQIGQRLFEDVLQGKRGSYGKEVVQVLSEQLKFEYGDSFSQKNLWRMIQFYEIFPDHKIVVSLIRHLSWTHFLALIPLKKPLQREFYSEMCRVERWSVRTLRSKIDSMLYERTALSKKPAAIAKTELESLRSEDKISANLVFKDPYFLDFLGLRNRYLEKDLEDAILLEIEGFLLEMGSGFSFLARQKRIQIDGDDFYIDLLFFHRALQRLIVIELKLGDFKAEHKGQMELYLRWLDKHERQPNEGPPLGIILCSGKKQEQIELLELDHSGIHVAEYLTVLPSKEILQKKLQLVIQESRERIENTEDHNESEI